MLVEELRYQLQVRFKVGIEVNLILVRVWWGLWRECDKYPWSLQDPDTMTGT